jgi:hypothetical protein
MRFSKTLGDELYSLYGPNDSNQVVHPRDRRRFAVIKELERHGLVKLVPRPNGLGLMDVVRTLGTPIIL